jgi:hypothetical protein
VQFEAYIGCSFPEEEEAARETEVGLVAASPVVESEAVGWEEMAVERGSL